MAPFSQVSEPPQNPGRFNNATRNNIDYYISRHIELTSNQVSIVFKCYHNDGDWLFTGDANKVVFERLISQATDISAKYLKIPHHGSSENLSINHLKAINPSYAIVSHKNRRFGRSKDTHPHHEIIDMIDREHVTCYYTNPVIKDKKCIKEMTTGPVLGGLITFK